MNNEDILLYIAGGLIIVYFTHLLSKERGLREAKKRFREAFRPEIILFDESTKGINRHTDRLAMVEDMHNRHARAVDNFMPYLRKRKSAALKDAWLNYKNYIDKYNFIGWFDANGLFYSTDAGRDHKRNARELLNKILSYAKE